MSSSAWKGLKMTNLSSNAVYLLTWLGQEEYSQYGECHGPALDELIEAGYAKLHSPGKNQASFIAKGSGDMYRAVSLTKKGIKRLVNKHKEVEE